jgi:hypothetical protein
MIIPHTIDGKTWLQMPIGDYVLKVRVSAQDLPPVEPIFKAWVTNGAIKCVQL